MEVTINVPGLTELAVAINRLAEAGTKGFETKEGVLATPGTMQESATIPNREPALPQTQMQSMPAPRSYGQMMPAGVPVQSQMTSNIPMQTIPTTNMAAEYTQDQIAVAMTGLMDAGKQDALMGILAQFNAQSLMQIPKEQYPAVVMALRGAGANI